MKLRRISNLITLVAAFVLMVGDAVPALAAGGGAPKVTLLKSGKGKKAPLRYNFEAGQKGNFEMAMDMDMTVNGNGVVMPTMLMTMSYKLEKAIDSEWSLYSWKLTNVDIKKRPGSQDAMVAPLKEQLAQMKGVKGTTEIITRGFSRNGTIDIPPSLPAEIAQMMSQMTDSVEQMAAPLPAEAIGVGGRWRVDMKLNKQGMSLTQTATYKLKKRTRNGFVASVKFSQTAPKQVMKTAGSPTLEKLRGSGKGNLEVDLSKLAPKSSMALKVDIGVKSGEVSVGMNMGMKLRIKPGRAGK